MIDAEHLEIDWLVDVPMASAQRDVLYQMRAALVESQAKVKDLQIQLNQLQNKIIEQGGLILNAPDFDREVARMLAVDIRYGGTSSILYFSLENFNDANEGLKTIINIFLDNIRGSDIIGRLGVSEFGILLLRCDNLHAWEKAEVLARSLTHALGAGDNPISISFGAYTFKGKENLAEGLKTAFANKVRSKVG